MSDNSHGTFVIDVTEILTRPASADEPSGISTVADTSSVVEPAPVVPTHDGANLAVGEDRKPVGSLHSSGNCTCRAFAIEKAHALGYVDGWLRAISAARAAVTDDGSRQRPLL